MRFRKVLGLALAASFAFSLVGQPAQAGDSGVKGDSRQDTIDFLKHPQNTFRPPLPYSSYQYMCDGSPTTPRCDSVMDLVSSQVITDPVGKKITFKMTTSKAPLPNGSPVTSLPPGFTSVNYSWYFQVSHQDSRMQVGTDCLSEHAFGNMGTPTERVYLTKVARSGSCPVARVEAGKTTEADRVQDGTKTRPADLAPIYTAPRARSDGWWGVVTLELKFDSRTGNLQYKQLWGRYEGYSGFSESEEKGDAMNESQFSFSVSGNTITATVPYEPLVQFGIDDDLFIDDAIVWPWPFGRVGSSITAMTAQINGVAEVGSPTALCPFGPDITPEEGTIPPVGYPQNLPGADGGKNCVRGVYGLLVVRDWTDGGFELRQVPRSPGYAPGSVDCRYPIGYFPAAPAPVTMDDLLIGAMPGSVDASTSPFHQPWSVGVYRENAGGSTTVAQQAMPALPNPVPAPITLPIGKDKPCNYTYVPTGLHYHDVLSPDVPM